MAVRLSVVMVHSPPPSANAARLAEAIVGELIGLQEIDLTLVGNLVNISDDSTDRLSLESLSGDVAALDWQPPAAIVAALDQLGFEGSRAPHTDDPQAPAVPAPNLRNPNLRNPDLRNPDPRKPDAGEPTRRIYAFDLNQFSDARSVCAALADLKTKRQVRTFTLSPVAAAKSTSENSATPRGTATGVPNQAQTPNSGVPAEGSAPSGTGGESSGPLATGVSETSLNLDELLDQLDELDP